MNQIGISNVAFVATLILIAILIILVINWRKISHQWHERSTRRSLNQIGVNQIKDVIYSDGLDGNFKIDRLVMLHDKIMLIAFKPYSGNIYCAESISEWTQVIGQKSYKFSNPLFELDNQVTLIQGLVPDVLVCGVIIFDHSARFPKGHPDNVFNPDNIPEYFLRSHCPEPKSDILRSWETLLKSSY